MKKSLLFAYLIISIFSCSKDSETPNNPDPNQNPKSNLEKLSDQKVISTFKIIHDGTVHEAIIRNDSVIYELPSNADLGNLAPEIKVSDKATVSPASGSKQNFVNTVVYSVIAENKTVREYKAVISKTSSQNSMSIDFTNLAEGKSFYLLQMQEPTDRDTILYRVPYLSPIKALTSVINIHEKAVVEPASGATLDYSNPVAYKVIAEDGMEKDYLVIVDNSLEQVKIEGILGEDYRGKLPGAAVSFTTNSLNPVQDSINVSLITPDGASVAPLSLQNIDYDTNRVTFRLPDSYKNDLYRFKIAIEHDNEDLSDSFTLDQGEPNFKALNQYSESGTGMRLSHETLLVPGEKFYADLFLNRARFNEYGFFLRQNGQDYEFANVELNPSWDNARFTMPGLTGSTPIDGTDFEMVIKLDGNENVYPLQNADNNPISLIVGKPPVITSIDKTTITKGEQLTVSGNNLFFPHSSHIDTAVLDYSSHIELKNGGSGYYSHSDQLNGDGSISFVREDIPSGVYDLYFKNNIQAFPKIDPGIQITIELPPSNHPVLSVTEAKIYAETNATFGKQILIKFNANSYDANITKIVADNGDIVIGNYIFYPTSILTGKLSDEEYAKIWTRLGDGHVVINENGQEYILPFSFTRE